MECSICINPIVDKVFMTCSAQHPFCFKCLLQNIEANFELKSCPNCRGGNKYITITNDSVSIVSGGGFYTLEYFKKSLPILQKILTNNNIETNTCLISEYILVCYIKNKKQLDIVHKLMAFGDNIDDIVPYIKWEEKKSLEDIGTEVIGGIAEFFGMPTFEQNSRQQNQQNQQNDQRNRRQRSNMPFREQRNSEEWTPRIFERPPQSTIFQPFFTVPNSRGVSNNTNGFV